MRARAGSGAPTSDGSARRSAGRRTTAAAIALSAELRRVVELAALAADHATAFVHLRAEPTPSAAQGHPEHVVDARVEALRERVLSTGAPVVVDDLGDDPGADGAPRSAAGFPVVLPDGAVVGVLCVVDVVPRRLGDGARRSLVLLAEQTGAVLALEHDRRAADDAAHTMSVAAARAAQSEAVLNAVLDHAPGPIFAKDLTGRFLLANAPTHDVLGREPGTVVGRRLDELLPADVAEELNRNDALVAAQGPQMFTETAPGPDGEPREYLASKFPLRDATGAVWGIGGISVDVAAARQLADELAVAEGRYRALAEQSSTATLVTAGPDQVVRWSNQAAARVHGTSWARRLVGVSLLDLIDPVEGEELRDAYVRVLAGEVLRTRVHRARRSGDRRATVDVHARRILWEGEPAVLTELVDVSDEAERTQRVERSEQRLAALFEQAPVGYAEATPDGRLVGLNLRLATLLDRHPGRLHEDALVADLAVPADRPRLRAAVRAVGSGGADVALACTLRRSTGAHVRVQVRLSALLEGGRVAAVGLVVLDEQEQSPRSRQPGTPAERAERMLRALPDAVLACDADGVVLHVNTRALALLRRARHEVVGHPYTDLVPGEDDQQLLRAAARVPTASGPLTVTLRRGDGSTVPVEVLVGATRIDDAPAFVVSARDVGTRAAAAGTPAAGPHAGPRMLAGLLDAATGQAVLATDPDGRIGAASPGAEVLLGHRSHRVVGRLLDDLVEPGDLTALFPDGGGAPGRWLRLATDVDGPRTRLLHVRSETGTARDVLVTFTVQRGPEEPTGLLVVATDVTDGMERVRALTDSEQRFRLAFDHATTGMALVGLAEPVRGRYLQVNQALCDMLGFEQDELVGTQVAAVIDPDDLAEGMEVMRQLVQGELDSFRGERRFRRADGTPVWVDLSVALARDGQGSPTYVVSQYLDVTARKAAEAALTHAALFDALTGLANRTLLVDHMEQEIARARRTGGRLGLLYLDLDNFKDVNDSLGHDAGDALLVEVAARLRRCVRDTDTTARLGGDEFVVLCPGLTSIDELVALARRIEHALALDIVVGATSISVTASVGLAFPEEADVRAEDLLRDADAAMYQAKRNGRHRYEVADPALQARALRQVSLEAELRQALRDAEHGDAPTDQGLHLVYQPGFDMTTGRLVSVEALLRWHHPVRGLLLPGAFLDVAEERALMWPLGLWILRTAIRQAGRWRDVFGDAAPQLWVNVSAGQLGRNQLAGQVQGMLAEHGLAPSSLCLELTERQVVRSAHSTMDDLETLRAAGVGVAVDDFGTGHAGMEYLRRLPVSMMKIDRLFITDVDDDPTQAAITASMVAMGRSMDLTVVAEGVETDRQRAAVVRLGVDLAQGFGLARPTDVAGVDALLAAGAADITGRRTEDHSDA
ncbi:EAL domain-containing protein [Cellulomonas sp. SLBN-39]|uniref:sensor domain-containing protein n=1 Tax=Cellulomonas sp. SLBN-39 TaxID=2768446 RepID=UPI00135CB553|nr:EAL domain-containing protein [Cellulomonas sp. SLBN-39]